jgi:hypothetical protein
MVLAAAGDRPRRPTDGAAWMPQGTPAAVMTPEKHAQSSLAGALSLAIGQRLSGLGPRKNPRLWRECLTLLDSTDQARQMPRIDVVRAHDYMGHPCKAGYSLASTTYREGLMVLTRPRQVIDF